jgi:putative membrane protein
MVIVIAGHPATKDMSDDSFGYNVRKFTGASIHSTQYIKELHMGTVVFAFIHHLAILLMFACLFYEHLAIRPGISLNAARRLIRIDQVYGLCAMILLVVGLLRVFLFEKGTAYYLHNWAFYLKIFLFLSVALVSIYPTVVFLGWRDQIRQETVPQLSDDQATKISMFIRAELLLVTLMLPPAVLMAKGYGVIN